MANLQNILGTLLASGMGGHSGRSAQDLGSILNRAGLNRSGMGGGPAMQARGGMGVGPMAGLGALAYLAYRAYQERQQNVPPSGKEASGKETDRSAQPGTSPWGAPSIGSAGGSAGGSPGGILGGILGGAGAAGGGTLGERLSQVFQTRTAPPSDAAPSGSDEGAFPPLAMEDQHALLLIRAMIAAANADGEISAAERQRVLSALDEAGGGAEERQIVERELSQPQSLDALVRAVTDPDMAEQVYLASLMAVDRNHEAERAYLAYLATRLRIAPQRAEQLNQAA